MVIRNVTKAASICAGVFYLIAAAFGATIVALFSISPKALVLTIGGLALLGTLANSLAQAVETPEHREAALVTFLITISGMSFYGIGAAFWGVIGGMLVQFALSKR